MSEVQIPPVPFQMKIKKPGIFVIALAILLVILLFSNTSKKSELEGFSLSGTIDYDGIPKPEFMPIHGFNYYLIVDENQRERVNGLQKIVLLGDLSPELEGKQVIVEGLFIENYLDYKIQRGELITSADPEGEVILVSNLK